MPSELRSPERVKLNFVRNSDDPSKWTGIAWSSGRTEAGEVAEYARVLSSEAKAVARRVVLDWNTKWDLLAAHSRRDLVERIAAALRGETNHAD